MTPSNQTVENTIIANGTEISVISSPNGEDYISLTDIARHRNPEFPADVIKNWLRLRSTIEYLGVWEEINNPNFNWSNSTSLKTPLVQIRSLCHQQNGFVRHVQLEFAQNPVDMAEERMRILILHSSSLLGFLLNLNSTSYVIINVLNKMKVIVLH